tara:strand:- start:221 stop:1171 length:951 start_codon:yes stop_codon:yes gene_type:complete
MNSSKVFFSVIIPCFNVEDTINTTINSVLNQDFIQYEIIAVNDGSNDKTSEILNSHNKDNLVKVINQKNKGLGAARNAGIKHATGEYICLLDADDIWTSNKLSKIYSFIKKNSSKIISNDEIILEEKYLFYLRNKPPKNLSNLLLIGNSLSPSAMTINKNIFKELGYFKEDKNYLGVEDWDFWIRLLQYDKKISHVNLPLGIYRRDIQNMSKSSRFNKRILKLYKIKSKYFQSIGIISKSEMASGETFLNIINYLNYPNKKNMYYLLINLRRGGYKFLISISFIKIIYRIIFRKFEGMMLTLFKYRRLRCIAKELL